MLHQRIEENDETGSEASCENEDSFLGANFRIPPARCRHNSVSGPLTSKLSNENNHRRRVKSLNNRPVERQSAHEGNPIRSNAHPTVQRTSEELQIQQLYMEARRHQAATARVTQLKDFQTMTFTLPAAKQTNALKPKHQNWDGFSPLKNCPLISTSGSPLKNKQRGRVNGPMFRGKKSRTTSAAAGSFVAEADQADQYYCKNSQRTIYKTKKQATYDTCVVKDVEDDEEENKQRWKSLLPRKWTAPKSMAVEI